MSKRAMWVQTLVFLAFLAVFSVLLLALPKRGFSERENRVLQTVPQFSFSALFSGTFTTDFEDYITDQFPLRDSWTTLKARCELLTGKDENKGIFLCEDETLIEGFDAPDYADPDFHLSLDAVRSLAENTDAAVYFALIPSASEIWRDMLPDGAPNDSQKELIDYAYSYTDAHTVDLYSALSTHADEPIFYRTDHHWTTLGAYYGYAELVKTMGIPPLALAAYGPTVATEDFCGTTWSSSGFSWVRPESIITYVEQGDVAITNYPEGKPVLGTLYDSSFLDKKDKYSYFYGGNTPLLEIETGNTDAPSLLIVRDSYMDSLSPYLFPHFSQISIIDLRYYRTSLSAYIGEKGFDNVLVCYSVPNFSTDGNIFLVGR